MSELDLGGTAGEPAGDPEPEPASASRAPVDPPESLQLNAPAPVGVVAESQAAQAVQISDPRKAELAARAAAFADELAVLDPHSAAFTAKIEAITSMGDREMRSVASTSNRMLERPAAVVKASKGGRGGDSQTQVSNGLLQLRRTVTELDPNRADLGRVRKVLKWVPGANRVQRYFAKYQAAQTHIDAIIKSLDSGQDELRKDNGAIDTEKTGMWTLVGKLGEYNQLSTALDQAVTAKIEQLRADGRTAEADALTSDALFAIRQRRQDVMTQMAVAVQGYLALDLVRRNNLELIRGVDRVQTTTVAALRTAVSVSQALSRQQLVLNQINALQDTTSSLIESTSQRLREQGTEVARQASGTAVDVQKLQAAFENVFQTMDTVDTFRAQAVTSMSETITALEGQIEKSKPYLERSRRADGSASGSHGQITNG